MPKMFLPENGQVGFVRVEGDSMTPTIAHGDYVAVEFDSGYTSDGLYLIRIVDLVNKLGNTDGNTGKKKTEESGNASIRLAYSRKSQNDC